MLFKDDTQEIKLKGRDSTTDCFYRYQCCLCMNFIIISTNQDSRVENYFILCEIFSFCIKIKFTSLGIKATDNSVISVLINK